MYFAENKFNQHMFHFLTQQRMAWTAIIFCTLTVVSILTTFWPLNEASHPKYTTLASNILIVHSAAVRRPQKACSLKVYGIRR